MVPSAAYVTVAMRAHLLATIVLVSYFLGPLSPVISLLVVKKIHQPMHDWCGSDPAL